MNIFANFIFIFKSSAKMGTKIEKFHQRYKICIMSPNIIFNIYKSYKLPHPIMYRISVSRGLGSFSLESCLLEISWILIIYVRVRDASTTQHCGVIPVHDGTSHSIFQHQHTLIRMPFLHFPIIYKAETNT